MQCPDMQELSAYVDSEMTTESKLQLQLHLQQCPQCREKVGALEVENIMIRDSLRGIEVPAGLGTYVQSRLRQQEQSWRTLKAGVIILLLVSGLFALADSWIPLVGWLASVLQTIMGGSLAMQMLVILGRLLTAAAGHVLRGEPLGMTPTFIILLACLAGLLIQNRKGGYNNA